MADELVTRTTNGNPDPGEKPRCRKCGCYLSQYNPFDICAPCDPRRVRATPEEQGKSIGDLMEDADDE